MVQDQRSIERWLNEGGHTAREAVIQHELAASAPVSPIGRLLVVADATVAAMAELPPAARAVMDAAAEVYVLTPSLPGRLDWLSSGNDRSRHLADERLDTVLGQMQTIGARASEATDQEPVMSALTDAVTEFLPDQILIGLRGPEHANWQERGLLDNVAKDFGVPLISFAL